MTGEVSLQEQLALRDAPGQIKELLAGLVDDVERFAPLFPKRARRDLAFCLERLVREATQPDLDLALWEVALDLLGKAARTQGEGGRRALELVSQLSPLLQAIFEPPGEVTLEEVTEGNLAGVILLSETLSEPKSNFVAHNVFSLAQALVNKHAWYRAIYAGKTLAGFLMLYDDPEKPRYYLWRFMIAEPFHGRGYGRQAIQRLIEHVRTRPGAAELLLSCGEGEGSPEGFYARQGFTRTGEKLGHEIVMRIAL